MECDLCIYRRGSSIGKIKTKNQHTQTYKIIINNKELKDDIIKVLLDYDWFEEHFYTSTPAIYKVDIYKLLKSKIPGIK